MSQLVASWNDYIVFFLERDFVFFLFFPLWANWIDSLERDNNLKYNYYRYTAKTVRNYQKWLLSLITSSSIYVFLIGWIFPFGSIFMFNEGAVTGIEKTQIRDCQTDSFLSLSILNFYSPCEGTQKKITQVLKLFLFGLRVECLRNTSSYSSPRRAEWWQGGQDWCHLGRSVLTPLIRTQPPGTALCLSPALLRLIWVSGTLLRLLHAPMKQDVWSFHLF